MSTGTLRVEHTGPLARARRELKPVTRKAAGKGTGEDSYQLILGSADDTGPKVTEYNRHADADRLIPLPVQLVPRWAVDLYRKDPHFQHLEEKGVIRISSPA